MINYSQGVFMSEVGKRLTFQLKINKIIFVNCQEKNYS